MRTRYWLVAIALVLAACGAAPAARPESPASAGLSGVAVKVFMSPGCSCCHGWMEYLRGHGMIVAEEARNDMTALKAERGVPSGLASCHTAVVGGYVVEGHVPVEAIGRLLAEKPAVAGIAVGGMPIGSPGMEVAGQPAQPYAVMAFDRSGGTSQFLAVP